MSAHQASLLIKTAASAFGLARLPTAAALLFLMMMKEVNFSAQHLVPLAHSASMLTQLTADNISFASMESQDEIASHEHNRHVADRHGDPGEDQTGQKATEEPTGGLKVQEEEARAHFPA